MQLDNEVIYQVFVRNYSSKGDFNSLKEDLNRIKDLGVSIIYLMPIHEIGNKNRKGTYGSPYANKDYLSISKDLGSLSDFKSLVSKIHDLGMKVILDMVFNHTAPDNVLVSEHPEYYYRKPDGSFGNHVGDWSDIIDLDTSKEETQDYLVSVLKYWNSLGVDGFRFDVATMVNFNVFKKARKLLGEEVIFLSESIDDDFAKYVKSMGLTNTEDKDLYPIFNSAYNYSWYRPLERYLKNTGDLKAIIDSINLDQTRLNKNFFRVNCLENHDTERIASLIKDKNKLKEWIRFSSFLKGNMFIYAGEEYGISHKPELFEKDPIDWSNKDLEIYELYKSVILDKKKQKHISYQKLEILKDNIVKVTNNLETKEFKL